MYELIKSYQFDVKEGLSVNYETENLPVIINGENFPKAVLSVKILTKDKYNENDIICEYDKQGNSLNIDFTDFEDENRIKKSDIILKIPKKSNIKVITENGKIIVSNLEGEEVIENENGILKLEKIIGSLKVTSENAMLKIVDFQGKVTTKTENSMIDLQNIQGDISTISENGMVKISKSKGMNLRCKNENGLIKISETLFDNVSVKNERGSIFYEVANSLPANINIRNEKGKIKIKVEPEVQFDVTAKTVKGNIKFDAQGSLEKWNDEEFKVTHLVNGAGFVKLNLINEKGTIILSDKDMTTSTGKLGDYIESILEDKIFSKQKFADNEKFKELKKEFIDKNIENIEKKAKEILKDKEDAIFNATEDISKRIVNGINVWLNKAFDWMSEKEKPQEEEIKKRSRMKILKMLEEKKITAEQAERLLDALREEKNE